MSDIALAINPRGHVPLRFTGCGISRSSRRRQREACARSNKTPPRVTAESTTTTQRCHWCSARNSWVAAMARVANTKVSPRRAASGCIPTIMTRSLPLSTQL